MSMYLKNSAVASGHVCFSCRQPGHYAGACPKKPPRGQKEDGVCTFRGGYRRQADQQVEQGEPSSSPCQQPTTYFGQSEPCPRFNKSEPCNKPPIHRLISATNVGALITEATDAWQGKIPTLPSGPDGSTPCLTVSSLL